jgi:glucose-6-phosphate dehydrogenase assembly protein OpcA
MLPPHDRIAIQGLCMNLPPEHSMDLSSLGKQVDVASIDLELRRFREQDQARTHASLVNLVVCSEEPGSMVRNSEMVSQLTRDHACRSILVEMNRRAAEPSVKAWVTSHCHLSGGQKSVCCEQIAFLLAGRATGRLRNRVFAHLIPDLPLVFWWQGELSDVLTDDLIGAIDRFVFDSASWADPLSSFLRIDSLCHAHSDLILNDHEWSRTWQFRAGTAAVFDDIAAQALLPKVGEVEIVHHPAHRTAALLFLSWLATQAGWKDGAEIGRSFVGANGQTICASLREDVLGRPVSEFVLRACDGSVRMVHDREADRIERCIEMPTHRIVSHAPADPVLPVELFAAQLARGGRNLLLRKLLPRVITLLKAIENR